MNQRGIKLAEATGIEPAAFLRATVFRTTCIAANLLLQKIKKLPSQEQDSNLYFQLNIWRATNYTIQLSFLNEGAGGELNPHHRIHNPR